MNNNTSQTTPLDFCKELCIILCELIWENHLCCTKKFGINACVYVVAMRPLCTGCLPHAHILVIQNSLTQRVVLINNVIIMSIHIISKLHYLT